MSNKLERLPACMMPDGAEPCEAYTELYEQSQQRLYAIYFLISRLSSTGVNLEIKYEDFKAEAERELETMYKGLGL